MPIAGAVRVGPALSTPASASSAPTLRSPGTPRPLIRRWSGAPEAGWSRPDQPTHARPVAFRHGPAQLRVAGPPHRRRPTPSPGAPAIANHPPCPSRAQTGSDALNASIARTAPAVLALLADGVPRNEKTIVAALADRHPKDEVKRTLMRLAVTDRLAERGGRFTLPRADAPDEG